MSRPAALVLLGLLCVVAPLAGPAQAQAPAPASPTAGEQADSQLEDSQPADSQPADSQPAESQTAVAQESQPGRVTLALSPEETTVGGRVRAEITVVWMGAKPSEPVRFPTWQETWGDAEVIEHSTVDAFEDQSGRFVYRQTLQLSAFRTGEVELPPRAFSVPLGSETVELQSAPQSFTVLSVLPPPADEDAETQAGPPNAAGEPDAAGSAEAGSESAPQPRDNAPPTEIESRTIPFAVALAALTLLAAGGLEKLRRRLALDFGSAAAQAAAKVDPLTLLEPLPELMARLDRLDPLHASAAAHTGLSLALRRYLGRRLGFPAVESTTTEIQRQLTGRRTIPARALPGAQDHGSGWPAPGWPAPGWPAPGWPAPAPPAALLQQLLSLLRTCDLVKFAGVEVDGRTADARLREAREIGNALERALAPPPAPFQASGASAEAAA